MKAPAATARAVAAQVVASVVHGRSLDDALDEQFARLPKSLGSERALIQEMSYGTVRWLLRLEPLLQGLLDKPLKEDDDDLHALLLVGLYQLVSMRVAKHAAVKETVEAARVLKMDWAKGLVNAVLRRALREESEITAHIAA
ncbi:MAG: 16S rRNA (cytosine(967)-C(5))-methyltransferase, partial [Gammaproteobacteria bacterium]|nr:16S rRNA (cytosine(967)-C(5))-methyltransferase [Gammaproteobacteria bacterium]